MITMKKRDGALLAYWERSGLKFRKPKSRPTKREVFVIKFIAVFTFSFLISQEIIKFYNMYYETNKEIACLYSRNPYHDILTNDTVLPTKSIFIVDPYCCGKSMNEQSCAIESAALAHPAWQINVIHAGVIPHGYTVFEIMRKFKNVKFWMVNIEDFAQGTPLEDLVKSRFIKNYCLDIPRSTDIIKYLTLYRWPGIYIDTDMIVGRSFDFLAKNWVVRADDENVGQELLAFSEDEIGRDMAKRAVREIQEHSIAWCSKPDTMRKVLQNYCTTSYVDEMKSSTCNGFHVYRPEFFYPLTRLQANIYFREEDIPIYGAITYYLWGKGSKRIPLSRSSPYNMLAREYCPKTFSLVQYRRRFKL